MPSTGHGSHADISVQSYMFSHTPTDLIYDCPDAR